MDKEALNNFRQDANLGKILDLLQRAGLLQTQTIS